MKNLIPLFLISLMFACGKPSSQENAAEAEADSVYLKKEDFQKEIDGKQTDLYVLENENGVTVYLTNYGARIVGIITPDLDGNLTDISPGYSSIDEYIEKGMYLGCVVGRYANRIKDGKFSLDNVDYTLAINNGPNALHGGEKGFDKQVWDVVEKQDTIVFSYTSKEGEEGYPGTMNVTVAYSLNSENELSLEYSATTDRKTIINLTNHNFFNLKGEGEGTILDHYLQINSNYITPVDSTLIPTGSLLSIQNTPFDFNEGKVIGQDIEEDHQQLIFGQGYDHNWVVNQEVLGDLTFAAKLWEPTTGRYVEFSSTEPGLQVYTGNFMRGQNTGKAGKKYEFRSAIALESQHFPNSPNQENFPSTILLPNDTYHQLTVWKFGVMDEWE